MRELRHPCRSVLYVLKEVIINIVPPVGQNFLAIEKNELGS